MASGKIKAILLSETYKAYKIEQQGEVSWIPKSQSTGEVICRGQGDPDRIEMILPDWLITEKNLFEED